MSVTATAAPTLGLALEQANPNTLADALRKVNLSKMLEPQLLSVDQTAALTIPLDPPALLVQSVRVTQGAATLGMYLIGDSAATPAAGICAISDDGATLTFNANVEKAVIVYMARSEASLSDAFPASPSK